MFELIQWNRLTYQRLIVWEKSRWSPQWSFSGHASRADQQRIYMPGQNRHRCNHTQHRCENHNGVYTKPVTAAVSTQLKTISTLPIHSGFPHIWSTYQLGSAPTTLWRITSYVRKNWDCRNCLIRYQAISKRQPLSYWTPSTPIMQVERSLNISRLVLGKVMKWQPSCEWHKL